MPKCLRNWLYHICRRSPPLPAATLRPAFFQTVPLTPSRTFPGATRIIAIGRASETGNPFALDRYAREVGCNFASSCSQRRGRGMPHQDEFDPPGGRDDRRHLDARLVADSQYTPRAAADQGMLVLNETVHVVAQGGDVYQSLH